VATNRVGAKVLDKILDEVSHLIKNAPLSKASRRNHYY
jgi:hypothetical protein